MSAASVQEENIVELRRAKSLNFLCNRKKDKKTSGVKKTLNIKAQSGYCHGTDTTFHLCRWWRRTVYFDQIGVLLIQDHIQFSLV